MPIDKSRAAVLRIEGRADKLAAIDKRREALRAERDDAIREARSLGVPVSLVAESASISTEMVRRIAGAAK